MHENASLRAQLQQAKEGLGRYNCFDEDEAFKEVMDVRLKSFPGLLAVTGVVLPNLVHDSPAQKRMLPAAQINLPVIEYDAGTDSQISGSAKLCHVPSEICETIEDVVEYVPASETNQKDRPPAPRAGSDGTASQGTNIRSTILTSTSVASRHSVNEKERNDLKLRIKSAIKKKKYQVETQYYETGICAKIARDQTFEVITMCVIAGNSLWIAFDTDYNDSENMFELEWYWHVGENFFCLFYSIELMIRFLAFKKKRNCLRDSWFLFDAALLSMMIFETWFITALILTTGNAPSNPILSQGAVLRLLRLLRLTRMTRMIRMLRFLPELMVFIHGFIAASRSVVSAFLLLVIVLYLASITLVQLGKDRADLTEYFATVWHTLGYLLVMTVLPDMWPYVVQITNASDTSTPPWILAVILILFLMVACVIVLNMLVGVLVEVVATVMHKEQDRMDCDYVKSRMEELIDNRDLGLLSYTGNGLITKEDFEILIQNRNAAKILDDVGVDVIGLADISDFIYKDYDTITFDHFVEVVLEMRNHKGVSVKDIHYLRRYFTKEIDRTLRYFDAIAMGASRLPQASEGVAIEKCFKSGTSSASVNPFR
jgi:hypothetical protein